MDGLEAVEIRLSKLKEQNEEFRIDSEFLLKEYLLFDKRINDIGYDFIDNFSFVTDGIHESIDFDDSSKINLLSAKSPKNNVFDLSGNGYISKKQHKVNPRTALKENDIIISTVGTIGNCAVVDESILPANSDRHVGIIRVEKKYRPYYLSTFLLTKYGRTQSLRHSTGNVQLNLFIYKIRSLKVPFFNDDFQKVIENIVLTSHELIKQSNALYDSAQSLLLSKLGLADYASINVGIAVKTFANSFGKTGRLDSEYYQPKYDELFSVLGHFRTDTLGNMVSVNKSIEPGSDFYGDEGVPFVRISNLSKYEISDPNIKIPLDTVQNISELYPKKDTILLSKDGSVGIAYKLTEDMQCVTSGAILHLKVKNTDKILPDYLTLVLNSIVVQMQAERDAGGSIIQHWKPSEISEVVIPVLDMIVQNEIVQKVQESFELRKKSAALLEAAKQAVEIAIEQCEVAGIDFLNRLEGM